MGPVAVAVASEVAAFAWVAVASVAAFEEQSV